MNPVSLGKETTNWSDITQVVGTTVDGFDRQYSAFTSTWTIAANPPAATPPIKPYWNVDGINGALMVHILEGNVGTATVQIEGMALGGTWVSIGYLVIVSNGATQTGTLARVAGGLTVAQNGLYVLQLLDAYPLVRTRPSANAGSLTASLYAIPA